MSNQKKKISLKLGEISELINGELKGDPETVIYGIAPIDQAKKGHIALLVDKKYISNFDSYYPSAIIVKDSVETSVPMIQVKDPKYALALLLNKFFPKDRPKPVISKDTNIGDRVELGANVSISHFVTISDDAKIGNNVVIYPSVFVGKFVEIGDNSTIFPNVSIMDGTKIGENVTVHSGTVIGSDGFGYYTAEDGCYKKVPQVGNVVIENGVEIGANVCIDRGTLGDTIIKSGSKIDNLVQIGHNVVVGKNTVIAGQSGISGSCRIGKNVIMGGQVGVADHVSIEDGTVCAASSGVIGDLKRDVYAGYPAIKHSKWIRMQASLARLPDLIKKIRKQENIIKKLSK